MARLPHRLLAIDAREQEIRDTANDRSREITEQSGLDAKSPQVLHSLKWIDYARYGLLTNANKRTKITHSTTDHKWSRVAPCRLGLQENN